MSVRKWRGFGLTIAMVALASPLAHAEGDRPSRQTLDQMGLSGMVVMSDDEALAVRGQGYGGGGYMPKPPKDGGSMVQVFGNSSASISIDGGGAHSENGYTAKGPHYAAGKNGSFAGVVYTTTTSKGGKGNYGGGYGMGPGHGSITTVHSTVVFAGGFSSGKAF
jgi:hypothetical protein